MMQKMMLTLGLAALLAAPATIATADDRPATAAERAKVGAVLKANGFHSWQRIEYDRDDRKFEVDNARHGSHCKRQCRHPAHGPSPCAVLLYSETRSASDGDRTRVFPTLTESRGIPKSVSI